MPEQPTVLATSAAATAHARHIFWIIWRFPPESSALQVGCRASDGWRATAPQNRYRPPDRHSLSNPDIAQQRQALRSLWSRA
jgi:hypothetical protein